MREFFFALSNIFSTKCVLLLRHDVHLFSTDALPVGCSVYESSPEVSKIRTCDCLTQNLACHGCGSSVGYVIVAPCARCSPPSSPNTLQRNTNGHRFVFYASEVAYEERLYVDDDPDVVPEATLFSGGLPPTTPPVLPPWATRTPLVRPVPTRLKPGFLVYWHHLKRRGDLRGVVDDVRARASKGYGFSGQPQLVAGR